MAIDPSTKYPGQVDTTDASGYPHGRARNATELNDGTGTPLEEAWLSDDWGFKQALLAEAGLSPSGEPDKVGASQYLEAIRRIMPVGVDGDGELIFVDSDGAAEPRDRITEIGLWASLSDGNWVAEHLSGLIPIIEAADTSAIIFVPLSLPTGAVLTRVQAIVQPQAARATVGNRMQMRVERTNLDYSTPQATGPNNISDLQSDDGTTNTQLLDTGTISYTFEDTDSRKVLVRLRSGTTSGADRIFGLRAFWSDPGPRNF